MAAGEYVLFEGFIHADKALLCRRSSVLTLELKQVVPILTFYPAARTQHIGK